jgi:Putative transposase
MLRKGCRQTVKVDWFRVVRSVLASNLMRLQKFELGLKAMRLHTNPPVQDRYGVIRRAERTHHHEQKRMPLRLDEFLRRFLLHLLPQGLVQIRHFGFLANRRRATLLAS